jgi:hypothetical protein
MARDAEPPVLLDSTRVLVYAETGGAAAYTGRTMIFTGHKDDLRRLDPVPRLAICEDLATAGLLMFHCDSSWKVLAVETASSIEVAKQNAERGYVGITAKWIQYRQLTEEESKELAEEREVLRRLSREHPVDGNDPHAA